MTKAQFAALLAAALGGFGAGSLLEFQGGANPKALFVHTLRIELQDGGVPDNVVAYRTLVTPETDGGVDLVDVGPADCDGGNTVPIRNYAKNNCQPRLDDGGLGPLVQNIRIIEIRPGDDDGKAAVSVFGDTFGTCYVNKPAAVNTFIDSLTCVQKKFRSNGKPL